MLSKNNKTYYKNNNQITQQEWGRRRERAKQISHCVKECLNKNMSFSQIPQDIKDVVIQQVLQQIDNMENDDE